MTVTDPTARKPGDALSAGATGALVLADGTVFLGQGIGAAGQTTGEVCFNTAMTGYQEILTDPSYAGQLITFTFPHIGNVGANEEDLEATNPALRGVVLRAPITTPSNYRAAETLGPSRSGDRPSGGGRKGSHEGSEAGSSLCRRRRGDRDGRWCDGRHGAAVGDDNGEGRQ